MPASSNSYEFITNKIHTLKDTFPSLRSKSDDYVFSALAVKSTYYQNPALVLNDSDFDAFIVDGQYDGGVDVLLTDPNSEASNMVIGQSKYYQSISADDVVNALTKMALFYKDMRDGHYENVNEKVQGRFLSLNSEIGEESRIQFVFIQVRRKREYVVIWWNANSDHSLVIRAILMSSSCLVVIWRRQLKNLNPEGRRLNQVKLKLTSERII